MEDPWSAWGGEVETIGDIWVLHAPPHPPIYYFCFIHIEKVSTPFHPKGVTEDG